ncbi:F0F1 ATP synthase subunit delta, partial [Streptomyces bauhiniae]
MNGASREALAAARERLDALTDSTSVDAAQLADELAAVTALLDREAGLRPVQNDHAAPAVGRGDRVLSRMWGEV